VEVGHGRGLYVLLPEHLHLHGCVGELVGEVFQEVWEVRCRSVDDSHHVARGLGLVLAERQGHKLLCEALHLGWRQTGELLAVGVRHRRTSVGLLLDVDQAAELQSGQARRRGAVEWGAVAQPDHGGDGGGGRGSKSGVLVEVLLGCGGAVDQTAAAVPVDSTEELGQTQSDAGAHSLARAVEHLGSAVPVLHALAIFVLLFLLLLEFLQQQIFL